MQKGKVKWFNLTKKYGFIEPLDKSKDIFLHISALEAAGIDELKDQQLVGYEVESNNGRSTAVNLQLLTS